LETNPIPIKTALAMKGMIKEVFRLPLCAMEPGNREKLSKILADQRVL
jgi:4-hydroxy-tetrahydrodipicolinate synthase